jgi:hypothetical protein
LIEVAGDDIVSSSNVVLVHEMFSTITDAMNIANTSLIVIVGIVVFISQIRPL